MTRKDYRALAKVMANNRPQEWNPGWPEKQSLWENIRYDMANMLAEDNPLFNHQRFIEACDAV